MWAALCRRSVGRPPPRTQSRTEPAAHSCACGRQANSPRRLAEALCHACATPHKQPTLPRQRHLGQQRPQQSWHLQHRAVPGRPGCSSTHRKTSLFVEAGLVELSSPPTLTEAHSAASVSTEALQDEVCVAAGLVEISSPPTPTEAPSSSSGIADTAAADPTDPPRCSRYFIEVASPPTSVSSAGAGKQPPGERWNPSGVTSRSTG